MQAVQSGIIVCCYEVFRLLGNERLGHRCFNSTFIFTFCSKCLLHSFSSIAPTILHRATQSCLGREMQNHVLHRIKEAPVEKSSLNCRATQALTLPCHLSRHATTL